MHIANKWYAILNHFMKIKICLSALLLALCCFGVSASVKIQGCVVDDKESPIEFATIVLSQNGKQKYGCTSDDVGCFGINVEKGKYALRVSFVGYQTLNDTIDVSGDKDLGKLRLAPSSVMMNEITVTASLIRREADRYVMNVEDQPVTIGKNGEEMLRQAPGVFIQNNKITLNGKGGIKVYINDREIIMSDEQLLAYLKSLRAEDMSKIEVIPNAGAEFSADSQSGIIKIYTKKNRDNGIMGSVGLSGSVSKAGNAVSPNANISIHSNKLTLNLNGWGAYNISSEYLMTTDIDYLKTGAVSHNETLVKEKNSPSGGFTVGAIYDFNDRNSIGAQVSYYGDKSSNSTVDGISNNIFDLVHYRNIDTHQSGKNSYYVINPRLNYNMKLDTLGSSFKFIASYSINKSTNRADDVAKIIENSVQLPDSAYYNDNDSRNDAVNLSADFNKVFNSRWTFKAGVKTTFNKLASVSDNAYLSGDTWIPQPFLNFDIVYREQIYAAYAIGSLSLQRWKFNAGLRAEYTHSEGADLFNKDPYFDLFPNANAMYMFTDKGDYTVGLTYSRSIYRPSFWSLNPTRRRMSEYMYQVGNPELKPSYDNNLNLTWSFAYKYSLSFGYSFSTDGMTQSYKTDESDPQVLNLTWENRAKVRTFYTSVYAPINVTKWLDLNLQATYWYRKESEVLNAMSGGGLSFGSGITFNLPKEFYIECNVYGTSKNKASNIEADVWLWTSASLKKTFDNNKWTLSASVYKFDGLDFKMTSKTSDFVQTFKGSNDISFNLSVTYNFNSGKKFNAKSVDGNEDDSRNAQSTPGR